MPGNPPFKPEQGELSVGTESSQGTEATPSRTFGHVTEGVSLPDPTVNWLEERVVGHKREIFNTAEGQWTFEGGSVPTIPFDGAPIAYLFGKDATTADTNLDSSGNTVSQTGTTLHTITALTNDIPPTQTIEAAMTAPASSTASDFVRRFVGCAPTSGEITTSPEEELNVNLEYMGLGVNTYTSATGVALSNRDPWFFHSVDSNLTLFGTSFARLSDFSLSVNNNLSPGFYIEDTEAPTPFELYYGPAEYELSATITIDDNTLYSELVNNLNSNTPFTTTIQFKKKTIDERLRIEASGCHIVEAPHDFPGEEAPVEAQVTILVEDVTIKVSDQTTSNTYV